MIEFYKQDATGSNIAQAFGEGASATVNIGSTADEVALLINAAGSRDQTKIDDLARQLNVTTKAIDGFLSILKEEIVPPDQLIDKLTTVAHRHLELMKHFAVLDSNNPEAVAHISEATKILQNASCAADYDRVDALLEKIECAQDIRLHAAEELERKSQEATMRIRLEHYHNYIKRAELSLVRLSYLQSAMHFRNAANCIASVNSELKHQCLFRSGDSLRSYGDEKGHGTSLLRSIDVYSEVLSDAKRDILPLTWARAKTKIGMAFQILGDRESGTAYLLESVKAFEESLEERTYEQVPWDWALTQNNLGNALSSSGERDNGLQWLYKAIHAFQAALNVRTRERTPLDWSMTQHNLGLALNRLGLRETGDIRFREAINSFNLVLKTVDAKQMPKLWAITQMSLGITLRNLGERNRDVISLQQSVDSYRKALQEVCRERTPILWAKIQNNLGNALRLLGEYQRDTKWLIQSVTALREALKERTKQTSPFYWAKSEVNIGEALLLLGVHELSTDHLVEAKLHLELALGYNRDAVKLYECERIQTLIARADQALLDLSSESNS